MLRNQLQTVMDHRHHAQTEQVYLDDAEVGAILLVPLNNRAVRHRGALQRYDPIQLPLANHHASRMLAEAPRQILNAHGQLNIFSDTRMLDVETGMTKGMSH